MTRPTLEPDIQLLQVTTEEERPAWLEKEEVAHFLRTTMQPYNDTLEETRAGLDYALSPEAGKGGFLLLAHQEQQIVGALVMLNTGMRGYVPEHLLLYIAVTPSLRRNGIGQRLIQTAISTCHGEAIKLHVEPGNPAQRLYERMGFQAAYIDMRYRP